MKILYISERPPYPFFLGGAARCAHEIMHQLVTSMDIECHAIGAQEFSNPPWSFPEPDDFAALGIIAVAKDDLVGRIDCGYPVEVITNYSKMIGDAIERLQPDVIWTQMEGYQQVIDMAHQKGIHNILFVHDAEFDPGELKAVSDKVNGIVCSSEFLAKKLQSTVGLNAQVVYPCPKVDFKVNGDSGGYLTMINPNRVKGLDTFLKMAQALPKEKFLLVESWKLTPEALQQLHGQLASLPNVKFIRRVSDMSQVYKQTRLLLVPSVWEEGFGLVAVEAQSCHIPVIASARGGLPEAVGTGGILIKDYQNVNPWIKEIKRLLGDPVYYSKMAQRAFEHAHHESLSSQASARRFLDFCQAVLSNNVEVKKPLSMLQKLMFFSDK